MKDRVFIAWSGTNHVAMQVKNILEKRYNYICAIGGNADNNSHFSSVGDTVIQQMKTCNQAIVIFQNRSDGAISNNLFFELGYVLSMYGQKKVHCVKRSDENVTLPSDFDNSFVEPIKENSDDAFAQGIVDYFISRQKMSINENKMFLINNRYLIHDKINSHYSDKGSQCSDYELAQYILFYMQAAHLFGDEEKVYKEMVEFKNAHNFEFSTELSLAINLCLTYFDLVLNIKSDSQTSEVYIDQKLFWETKKEYEYYLESLETDNTGIFNEWFLLFVKEQLCFTYNLFANNPQLDEKSVVSICKKTVEYGYESIEIIDRLEEQTPCKENNDHIGLISLLKAYVYRNVFLAKKQLGEEDANDWLKKTMKERKSLKNNYGKGTIDTQLYNTFLMEYYLSLVNYLSCTSEESVSDFDVMMYKDEVREYLSSVKKQNKENVYIKLITHWCNI